MIGAGRVISERHWSEVPDKDGTGVLNPLGHRAGLCGVDLQVLSSIGIGHRHRCIQGIDQHNSGLLAA